MLTDEQRSLYEQDEIVYTGTNTKEVRAWVNADPGCEFYETWFITKSMSGPSGLQAWHYILGEADNWRGAEAAVFDPRTGEWQPMRRGDTIERQGSGYGVVNARG